MCFDSVYVAANQPAQRHSLSGLDSGLNVPKYDCLNRWAWSIYQSWFKFLSKTGFDIAAEMDRVKLHSHGNSRQRKQT